MFASLLKAKRAEPGRDVAVARPEQPTTPTVEVRLSEADLVLTSSAGTDVKTDGPVKLVRQGGNIVITDSANDAAGPKCQIEVPSGWTVEASSELGAVSIIGFDGTLRARVRDGTVTIERSDGRFRVVTRGGAIGLDHIRGSVDVLTTAGKITASEIDGELHLLSESGNMQIEQAGGPLVARSTTGSITASDLDGVVRLSTRTGAVKVANTQRQLTVRTQNGDISLEGSVVDHTTLESHKGSIEVRLGVSTDARIEASARQGVVRSERLPLATGSGRRLVRSALGEGRARLRIATGIGVVEVLGPRPTTNPLNA